MTGSTDTGISTWGLGVCFCIGVGTIYGEGVKFIF
jgi:hypothetical protein